MKTISRWAMFTLAVGGLAAAEDAPIRARVGRVVIDDHSVGGLFVHESRLEKQPDGSLKGREGDQLARARDGKVEVQLGAKKGVFTVASQKGVRTIDGEWGTGLPSHPVHIELAADHVVMKWGFYERRLAPLQSPQLPPECRRFARSDGSVSSPWIDVLDLCGEALSDAPPSPELVVALLLNGFYRDPNAVWVEQPRLSPGRAPPAAPHMGSR